MTITKRIYIPKNILAKYAGLTGAVVANKVVAGGATTSEALANTKKKFPKIKRSQIAIMSLPPRSGVWVL